MTGDELLQALLPYLEHHDRAYRGQDDNPRDWVDGCKKVPTLNRFGVEYGGALEPHPCTCGLDTLLGRLAGEDMVMKPS